MAKRLKNSGKRTYGKDADKDEKDQGKRTHGKPQRVTRKPNRQGNRRGY